MIDTRLVKKSCMATYSIDIHEDFTEAEVVAAMAAYRIAVAANPAIKRPTMRRLLHPRLGIRPTDQVTSVINGRNIEITFGGKTHIRPIPAGVIERYTR